MLNFCKKAKKLLKEAVQSKWFLPAVGLLLILLIYCPSVQFSFLRNYDDDAHILSIPLPVWTVENLKRYLLHPVVNLYIPLPMLSFMAERSIFGLIPGWFHFDNILLFCTAYLLFYLILRQLFVGREASFLFSLLWAFNPQRVESVAWITERKDLLCAVFALASVLSFLRTFRKNGWSVMSGIFAALSILCKPAAAALPGILFLLTFCIKGKRSVSEYFRKLPVPFLLTGTAMFWSMRIASETRGMTLVRNWEIVAHNFFWYISSSFIPYEINPFPPPVTGWQDCLLPMTIFLCFSLLSLFLAFRLQIPLWKHSIVLLCFLGLFLPVSGIMRYGFFHYCDRYTLFISMVLYAWAAVLAAKIFRTNPAAAGKIRFFLLLWISIFALVTIREIPAWKNDLSFALSLLEKKGPLNPQSYDLIASTAAIHPDSGADAMFIRHLAEDFKEKKQRKEKIYILFYFHAMNGLRAMREEKIHEAQECFRRVLALCKTEKIRIQPCFSGPLFQKMVWFFYLTGEKESLLTAGKYLQTVYRYRRWKRKEDCILRYILAEVRGDYETALQEAQKIRQRHPDVPWIPNKIRLLKKKLNREL